MPRRGKGDNGSLCGSASVYLNFDRLVSADGVSELGREGLFTFTEGTERC